MSSEEIEIIEPGKKIKNPKRVAAGRKGVEVRMRNAELRKKENERLKKENEKFKEQSINLKITKDDNEQINEKSHNPINDSNNKKYYIPAFIILGMSGIGLYFYKFKWGNSITQKQEQEISKRSLECENLQSEPVKKEKTSNYQW